MNWWLGKLSGFNERSRLYIYIYTRTLWMLLSIDITSKKHIKIDFQLSVCWLNRDGSMVFSPLLFCEVDHLQYFFWRWRMCQRPAGCQHLLLFLCVNKGHLKLSSTYPLRLLRFLRWFLTLRGLLGGGMIFVPPISVFSGHCWGATCWWEPTCGD